jgi:hypothetical protein
MTAREVNGMALKDNPDNDQPEQIESSDLALSSEDSHDKFYFDEPTLDSNNTDSIQDDKHRQTLLLNQTNIENSTSKLYLQEEHNFYDENLNEKTNTTESIMKVDESSISYDDPNSTNIEQEEVTLDVSRLFTEPFETDTTSEKTTTTSSENLSSDQRGSENEHYTTNTIVDAETEKKETVQNEITTEDGNEEIEITTESASEQDREKELTTISLPLTSEDKHVTDKSSEASSAETTHETFENAEKASSTSTSRKPIVIKPVVPGFIPNNRSSLMNAECPSLTCEFGFKVDLFNKPLCACYDPCVRKYLRFYCGIRTI